MTLIAISVVSFAVMSINPNDMLHTALRQMELSGRDDPVQRLALEALIKEFDLDKPWYERYVKWAWRCLHGDFGRSLQWYGAGGHPSTVLDTMRDKVPFTALLTILGTLVSYLVSFPLGIFCALKQYSIADFVITAFAFIGMAVPAFRSATSRCRMKAAAPTSSPQVGCDTRSTLGCCRSSRPTRYFWRFPPDRLWATRSATMWPLRSWWRNMGLLSVSCPMPRLRKRGHSLSAPGKS